MTTQASIAWRKHFEQVAKYDYSRAEKQSEESAQYVQGVSAHSRVYGMNDFKASLREEIARKIQIIPQFKDRSMYEDGIVYGLEHALKLLDTVKPSTSQPEGNTVK